MRLAELVLVLGLAGAAEALVGGVCTPADACAAGSGKCYNIVTQADADKIKADCDEIDGSVHVDCGGSSDLTSVDVFRQVLRVKGYVRIENCPGLVTLAPLGNLRVIEANHMYTSDEYGTGFALYLVQNTLLEELTGLQNLTKISSRVFISKNPRLCWGNNLNWGSILGAQWNRMVRYDRPDANCPKTTTCDSSCTCNTCVGAGPEDCQGTCIDVDDDLSTIAGLVVGFLALTLVMVFIHLAVHHQCGCRCTSKGGWRFKGRKFYPSYGPWEIGFLPELEDTKQYVPTQGGFKKPALVDPFGDSDPALSANARPRSSGPPSASAVNEVLDPFANLDTGGPAPGLRQR